MSYNRGTKYRIRAITVAYTVQEAGLVVVLPKFLTTRIFSFRIIINLIPVCYGFSTGSRFGDSSKTSQLFPVQVSNPFVKQTLSFHLRC